MNLLALAGAIMFVWFGWVLAIDQNRAWRWHEASARRKGFSNKYLERTSEWETDMAWRGWVFMGMGVLGVMVALCSA